MTKSKNEAHKNNPTASYTPKCVKPKVVGFHGSRAGSFKTSSCQINESPKEPVSPASLYEAQLGLRLRDQGGIPEWWTEAKDAFEFYKQNGYFETPLRPPLPPTLPPSPPAPPMPPPVPPEPPIAPPPPPPPRFPPAYCINGIEATGGGGEPRACCAQECGTCKGKKCGDRSKLTAKPASDRKGPGTASDAGKACCPGDIQNKDAVTNIIGGKVCRSVTETGCLMPGTDKAKCLLAAEPRLCP